MRRINRYLNTQLLDICQQTMLLEELNLKLSGYLPPSLQPHCHVGSFHRGCLILVVSDSVWASQLRYILPELRDKLRLEAGIYQLSSIKISISTQVTIQSIEKPPTPPLSTKAREIISASGDQCAYAPLKNALYKLGSRVNPIV